MQQKILRLLPRALSKALHKVLPGARLKARLSVLLAGLLSALLPTLPAVADVNVFSDRYAISIGETLQLTVEVNQRSTQRPDFSPLTKDFHFLGSKQMTVSSHAQGTNQYSTRWRILLRPRRAGDLKIPPLQLYNEQSQPLLISVTGDTGAAAVISREAYLESAVDNYELYQNTQLLYSQRLFSLNELPPMARMSEPDIPNTQILQLGEPRRYNRQIQGQNYQVTERNYALFPHQPGILTIPPAVFNAGPGTTELSSEPLQIDVLPKPTQKIKGYWLPARRLTLENMSDPVDQIILGDTLVRRIKVTAEGLTAEQLPALMSLRNELAELTIEDVILEQNTTAKGIISSRTEVVRITPKERGEVTLPAITIPWWNVANDKDSLAQLSAIVLRVEPAQDQAVITVAEVTQANSMGSTATAVTNKEPQSSADNTVKLLVWLLSAIATISSLGWLYSYTRLKRNQSNDVENPTYEMDNTSTVPIALNDSSDANSDQLTQLLQAEQDVFQKAINACNNDNPLEARLLTLEWARLFWPHNSFDNSNDLSELNSSKTLELLLIDMESYISGQESGEWSGDLLAEALVRIRESQLQQAEEV
ncbi:BatD family protein [Amphritea balenae]|uniref:DUF7939 domain-containing protein n=1 Tax=Amphritea balenae TaxID=452629 RepID=A0A3P1SVH1_9GAMM|nr:BatD family protein [Amphritea balenae]RRD00556.1 hypothetical protein EHS89_05570 [Amphritea balenae]GGK69762.1 hypothetical protein GCM10007941_19980 [Amphritea balenae]